MPIYEYVCTACGHTFEIFQGIKDAPLVDCQHCQKPSLTKLISASLFRLKGGGWYETDFKKDSDKKKNLISNENVSASAATSSETTATNHSAPTAAKAQTDPV